MFKTLPEQRDLARIMVATILQWRWTFKEQRHQARLQGNHNGMFYLADQSTDFNLPLQLPIVERWRARADFAKQWRNFWLQDWASHISFNTHILLFFNKSYKLAAATSKFTLASIILRWYLHLKHLRLWRNRPKIQLVKKCQKILREVFHNCL